MFQSVELYTTVTPLAKAATSKPVSQQSVAMEADRSWNVGVKIQLKSLAEVEIKGKKKPPSAA